MSTIGFTASITGDGRRKNRAAIGFTASLSAGQVSEKNSVNASTSATNAAATAVLTYDSGNFMTCEDLAHHLLFMGTTGSGKTESGILPALHGLVRKGCRGLILDVKGNLRGKSRGVASACGRGEDVIEYGISPTAERVNIISGMEDSGFHDFVKDLIERSFNGRSQNMDFHMKGAALARDCFKMLRWLEEIDPVFEPTLPMIAAMFDDWKTATELFDLFRKRARSDPEKAAFVKSVENTRFHILSQTKDKLRGAGSNHYEQMSYVTQCVRVALKGFLDTPGIVENFCRQGGGWPRMGDLLREGKIILLRFGPSTGPAGARLARLFLNSFYQAIYDFGLDLPGHSFVCVDEFQEVADLSAGRYSDTSFIAQTREFRTCFMAATQSASALMARGSDENAVRAFMANCNNKIMFFSDDPLTRALAASYDERVDLIDLKPGEAFVTRYDSRTRQHLWGHETLSGAYESAQKLQETQKEAGVREENEMRVCPGCGPVKSPGLDELVGKLEAKNEQEKESSYQNAEVETSARQEFRKITPSALQEEFSDLFTEDAWISIPVGWLIYVRAALRLFGRLGMKCKIERLELGCGGSLDATLDTGSVAAARYVGRGYSNGKGETDYLNRLLRRTSRICMLCGKILPKTEEKTSWPDEDDEEPVFGRRGFGSARICDNSGICPDCLKMDAQLQLDEK